MPLLELIAVAVVMLAPFMVLFAFLMRYVFVSDVEGDELVVRLMGVAIHRVDLRKVVRFERSSLIRSLRHPLARRMATRWTQNLYVLWCEDGVVVVSPDDPAKFLAKVESHKTHGRVH